MLMKKVFTQCLRKYILILLYLDDLINLWQLVLSDPNKGFIVRRTLESNLQVNKTISSNLSGLYCCSDGCFPALHTLQMPIQSHVEDMKSSIMVQVRSAFWSALHSPTGAKCTSCVSKTFLNCREYKRKFVLPGEILGHLENF